MDTEIWANTRSEVESQLSWQSRVVLDALISRFGFWIRSKDLSKIVACPRRRRILIRKGYIKPFFSQHRFSIYSVPEISAVAGLVPLPLAWGSAPDVSGAGLEELNKIALSMLGSSWGHELSISSAIRLTGGSKKVFADFRRNGQTVTSAQKSRHRKIPLSEVIQMMKRISIK